MLFRSKSGTKVTWVSEDFLAAQNEQFDLTPWSPLKGDSAAVSLTPTKAAEKAGLTCRPLADTVRDTLRWFQSLPAERQQGLHAALDRQKEADTLRAWHKANKKG